MLEYLDLVNSNMGADYLGREGFRDSHALATSRRHSAVSPRPCHSPAIQTITEVEKAALRPAL